MWAFSNRDPAPFAPQQVWASSFGIGLILFVFTAFQGIGGHFPGADVAFMEARPDLVNNVLGAGLGGKDLMESAGKRGMLVPQLIVSAMTQNDADRHRRTEFHDFLREHASLPAARKGRVPAAWIVALGWFFFGIGPGAVIGNTIFGSPNDATTWVFGMPSIRAWQILWWVLGVFMMWFLAYKMEMSTVPREEVEALRGDIADEPRPVA